MKLKTIEVNGETYAEIKDGKPVYMDGDKETTYDAPAMHSTIGRLNAEAKGHREAKEALEAKLNALGDADPAAAAKALETIKNIDQKKLIDADQVAQIKAEAVKPIQAKLDEALAEKEQLNARYATEKINASFAGSKYIKDNLAIPADMVQAAFNRHFEYQDGNIVAKDGNGVPILTKDGSPASFDEAIESIIAQYPNRDAILKGQGHSGSGSSSPNGGTSQTMRRAQFDALDPYQQHEYAKRVQQGEARLID